MVQPPQAYGRVTATVKAALEIFVMVDGEFQCPKPYRPYISPGLQIKKDWRAIAIKLTVLATPFKHTPANRIAVLRMLLAFVCSHNQPIFTIFIQNSDDASAKPNFYPIFGLGLQKSPFCFYLRFPRCGPSLYVY